MGEPIEATFVFEVAQLCDFSLGQLHHILDAIADVDETQAVVLQTECRKCCELLDRSFVNGCFVGEAGKYDLRARRHGGDP